jgi:O-phosphoseryl-tRNA synthetase
MGVERIAALLHGFADIRELAFPQFYGQWVVSDADLSRQIAFIEEPATPEGKALEKAIVKALEEHRDAPSPCEFVAYQGTVSGKKVNVAVYEPDPNVKLVGPAAFNEVVIHGASILGIPDKGMEKVEAVRKAREQGVRTGIRYADSVAKAAAARVEREGKIDFRVRMAKLPSDVNIRLSEVGARYVSGRQGRVDLRGPVFIGVRSEVA